MTIYELYTEGRRKEVPRTREDERSSRTRTLEEPSGLMMRSDFRGTLLYVGSVKSDCVWYRQNQADNCAKVYEEQ